MWTVPSAFQAQSRTPWAIDGLLQGIPHVAAYMNDILIIGETEEQYLHTLNIVLQKLETAGVRLQKSVSAYGPRGGVFGPQSKLRLPSPVADKIKEAAMPQCVSGAEIFSGHVLNTGPTLFLIVQKRWIWGREQPQAYKAAKELLPF